MTYRQIKQFKGGLTPSDLSDLRKQSGYKYVRSASAGPNGGGQTELWKGEVHGHWRGPYRRTPRESAQDVCDYMNGGVVLAPPVKKSAGHPTSLRERLPQDPEVQAALGVLRDARGQRQGRQGYVYLIIEVHPGGGLRYGKVGYSTNPRARVAELQTGNPRPLSLLYAKPGTLEDEAALHEKYADLNVLQEWFNLNARRAKDLLLEWNVEHYIKEDR